MSNNCNFFGNSKCCTIKGDKGEGGNRIYWDAG